MERGQGVLSGERAEGKYGVFGKPVMDVHCTTRESSVTRKSCG